MRRAEHLSFPLMLDVQSPSSEALPHLAFWLIGGAVYLNPNTGRFWTMDTVEGTSEEPQSLHLYTYCEGDSVNNADPRGNALEVILAVIDVGRIFFGAVSSGTAEIGNQITLDDASSDRGALERLVIAESPSPSVRADKDPKSKAKYPREVVKRGMKAICACVCNQVAADYYNDFLEATTIQNALRQKNPVQYAGFENYPTLSSDVQTHIDNILEAAKSKNLYQGEQRDFIADAKEIATQFSGWNGQDPFKGQGGTYGFRTENRGSPGKRYKTLGTIAHNTFFTITKPQNW
jgi:hypothetical protein